MLRDILGLAFSLAIILISCELFTNSIEWFGKRLRVGDGVVGSVFSAVGTCLPETMVPVIAILFSGGGSQEIDIGIGAITGAPFMLGTLGFFVTGFGVLLFRKRRGGMLTMNVNTRILKRDMGFFIVVYSIGIFAGLLPFKGVKAAIALFLACCYIFYLYRTFRSDHAVRYELDELYLARCMKIRPRFRVIVFQIALALAGIIFGANIFVFNIRSVSSALGIPALVLSLIITPVATELPEKFNSVLWVSRRRDTLALGNITGAMVFQSCIPVSIGLLATSWRLSQEVLASAILALISSMLVYLSLKYRKELSCLLLMTGGLFYIFFMVLIAKVI